MLSKGNSLETRSRLDQLPGFEPFEHRTWRTTQRMDRTRLLAHVRSRSNVAAMTERDRRRALNRVAELCDMHPDLANHATFELPYETQAFRARLETGSEPTYPTTTS